MTPKSPCVKFTRPIAGCFQLDWPQMPESAISLASAHAAEPARVQRAREFAQPENEWLGELVAASLCGAFALAGAFTAEPVSLVCYMLSYLAGSWFSVQDVWELLKKRI